MSDPHHDVGERDAAFTDDHISDAVFAGAALGSKVSHSEIADAGHSQSYSAIRLAAFDDRLTQLVANVSHDLLTPLTRIRLRVETASCFCGQQKIIEDIDEMECLVREGLTRTTGTRAVSEPMSKIEIAPFVTRLARDYADAGQTVRTRAIRSETIETRPRALRRVLTNLVDNALKFAGTAEIETDVRSERMVIISVLDRGPGIPSTHLLAAFERHCRVGRGPHVPEGLGLGLAIAKELTMDLSGTLILRNRKGGGLAAELGVPLGEPAS